MTELFLYAADRSQHIHEIIQPALQQNKIVLCDRFTDSTLAYQGYGRSLDLELIKQLNELATGGLKPDLTFLLDCPVELGLKRSKARLQSEQSDEDRFEQEALDFHERVRQGFLTLAEQESKRFVIINGTQEPEKVHQEILKHI